MWVFPNLTQGRTVEVFLPRCLLLRANLEARSVLFVSRLDGFTMLCNHGLWFQDIFMNPRGHSSGDSLDECPGAAVKKHHRWGGRWLKRQKCVLLQFWRTEVQDQGVGRLVPFWRVHGRICSSLSLGFLCWLPIFDVPWLIHSSLQSLPLSSHGCLPVCCVQFSPLV